MTHEEQIPDVWQDIESFLDPAGAIGAEDQNHIVCLYAVAACPAVVPQATLARPLSLPVQTLRILEQAQLELSDSCLFAAIKNIELSAEDWTRYQEGRDVLFWAEKPIPAIIFLYDHSAKLTRPFGIGHVTDDFLTVTRNFL